MAGGMVKLGKGDEPIDCDDGRSNDPCVLLLLLVIGQAGRWREGSRV
jgi:hypothetical protein